MFRYLLLITCLIGFSTPVLAMGNDDPFLFKAEADRLEHLKSGDNDHLAWDFSLWMGHDLEKLVFETEGKRNSKEVEKSHWSAFYQRALDANWDWQAGLAFDTDNSPRRNWFILGFEGDAPYHIETKARLYLGESGRSMLNIELEKEFLLSMSWLVIPEIGVAFNGQNDNDKESGSGLSSASLGLRLGYMFNPQFMLYTGVERSWLYGETADFATGAGEPRREDEWVAGVSFWY